MVLLYHFPVLGAFEFGEGVGILCFVLGALELAMVRVPLRRHRLDHTLLLEDDLLEGPAPFHPPLEVLFSLLVSHLPPLYLFSDPPSLSMHRFDLDLKLVAFYLTDSFQSLFHVGFALPGIFQLLFEPDSH